LKDPQGRTYYYNKETKESSWSVPPELQSARATAEQAKSSAAVAAPVSSAVQSQINQLCDMGFERSQVELCMFAAFNNNDLAVEYLMNGIPANVQTAALAVASAAVSTLAPAPAPKPSSNPWQELKDPQGRTYYYNKETKESSWSVPPELQSARATAKLSNASGPASTLADRMGANPWSKPAAAAGNSAPVIGTHRQPQAAAEPQRKPLVLAPRMQPLPGYDMDKVPTFLSLYVSSFVLLQRSTAHRSLRC
jgi:hypothetical protein